jgi:hypothetical protein
MAKSERRGISCGDMLIAVIVATLLLIIGGVLLDNSQRQAEAKRNASAYLCSLAYLPHTKQWQDCINEP